MNQTRRAWIVFATGSMVVAGALIWISVVVLRLEQAEIRARAGADHEASLQRALWRMDSWLALFLARESARPYADYLPPSPLLNFDSEYVQLHFHADPRSGLASPQLPALPYEELPESTTISPAQMEIRRDAWKRLRPRLDLNRLRSGVPLAESLATPKPANAVSTEFDARVSCTVPPAPGNELAAGISVNVGPLIPQWLPNPATGTDFELVFVRRLQAQGQEFLQGFFGNWPKLRERLRTEIRELIPGAELVRVSPDTAPVDPRGHYLANIPAQLVAGATPALPGSGLTPVRVTLGLAWLVTALAAVMIGVTLHKSIELGERRRRFVFAVTHELRTPLTTFRLYSEMLAKGLVRDEEQRLEYLRTLQDESDRLSAMVENVLAHARLEERVPRVAEKLTLGALLARVTPPLTRQVRATGMTLKLESKSADSVPVQADAEAVGQILRNLVDNATKYAGNGRQSTIHLESYLENGSLNLKVRDHGPGVPAERSRAIFEPFDRGSLKPSDPVPGIGLGLALARGLARDLGGDLKLESPPDGGACFHLVLPAEIS